MTKLFITRFNPNNAGANRYRTIVSKKLETSAVKRNYLRRQIYEAVRLAEKDKTATKTVKETFDIILIPKKNILSAKFEELKADILTLTHGKI